MDEHVVCYWEGVRESAYIGMWMSLTVRVVEELTGIIERKDGSHIERVFHACVYSDLKLYVF